VIIFTMTLKRVLIQPINLVFIVLFPVIFSVLMSVSDSNDMAAADDATAGMSFGIVDLDETALSQALIKTLQLRYNTITIEEDDISAALTDSEVPWVLLIREGYSDDILVGRAPVVEGYSLTISDVSSLGSATVGNITQALILLGTDDPGKIAEWEESSFVDVSYVSGDDWGYTTQWLGFFGFVAIFTAYFIIKTLSDDRNGGMPDRLGVMPHSSRKILVYSTLAAFVLTEATAALLILAILWTLGSVPNALFLFIIFSAYNLFCVGLVRTLISNMRDLGSASVVMTMIATVSAMLGGLFWPLEFVPEFMRKLAWVSPGYWLSRGIKDIRSITFEGFGMPILLLAAFSALVFLIGGRSKVRT